MARTYRISSQLGIHPIVFYFAICLVIERWGFHFFLSLSTWFDMLVGMIVLSVILIALSVTKFRHLRIYISTLAICLLGVVLFALIWIAPRYSVWYGEAMANRFEEAINVKVQLKEQQVRIHYNFDVPDPSRKVTTVYKLQESNPIAIEKLKNVLKVESGWLYKSDQNFSATCQADYPEDWTIDQGLVNNQVIITKDGLLEITLYYESPSRCRL